ncbi:MAG: protein kinase domain-containing protein, partial [Persicimonas sp.]
EASIMQSVDHPGVARVYGLTEVDDRPAIALELCGGGGLDERLAAGEDFDEDRCVAIAIALLEALSACHRAGIVHRDVKPHNIMFDEEGHPRLIDFGIGQAEEVMAADESGQVGTVEYIAPERIDGLAVDGRSDLYSVGVVLFELLCGHVPYRDESASVVMRMHREAEVPDPAVFAPDISDNLRRVVMTALAKHPEERFDDAEAMVAALRGQDDPPEEVPDHPDWRTLWERHRGDESMAAPVETEGFEWVVYLPSNDLVDDEAAGRLLVESTASFVRNYAPYYTGVAGDSLDVQQLTSIETFKRRRLQRFGVARGLSREGVDRVLDELGKAGEMARYTKRRRTRREQPGWFLTLTRTNSLTGILVIVAIIALSAAVSTALLPTAIEPPIVSTTIQVGAAAIFGAVVAVAARWRFVQKWWRAQASSGYLLDFAQPRKPVETRLGIDAADLERLDQLDSPRITASYERAMNMALHLDDLIEDADRRHRLEGLVDEVRDLAERIAELEAHIAAVRPGRLTRRIRRLDNQLSAEDDPENAQKLIDQKAKLRRQLTDRDEALQRLQADAQSLHALSSRLESLVRRHRDADTDPDEQFTLDLETVRADQRQPAQAHTLEP